MSWHASLSCHGHYFVEVFGEFPLYTQMTDFNSHKVVWCQMYSSKDVESSD